MDSVQRVRIDLAYDGMAFSGWAKQPGLITVQGCLERALELIMRQPVYVTVAGRTDAGVHALHQVVHFDVPVEVWQKMQAKDGAPSSQVLKRKLRGALSRSLADAEAELKLPSRLQGMMQFAIMIQDVHEVPDTFDARFSALERQYRYLLEDDTDRQGANPLYRHLTWAIAKPLDLDLMNSAAQELIGLHDFLSFCKPREGSTTIRQLRQLSFVRQEGQLIEATIRADAFCHNMVRTLIASLVMVGDGTKDLVWLQSRISSPVRDSQVRLAPPRGLALSHILYPDSSLYAVQAELARAKRELPTEL